MKSPIILRIFKNNQLLEIKQFEDGQIIFGNEGDVQVPLRDPQVSAIHCLIERRETGYYLSDLGSATGTYKNKNQVLDEPLSSGDQIGIGPFTIHFFVGIPKSITQTSTVSSQTTAPSAPVANPPPLKPPTPPQMPPQQPKLPEVGKRAEKIPAPAKGTKQKKTFAPASEITDLRKYLRPTKGLVIEVIVAWQERILATHHFSTAKYISIGSEKDCDISLPASILSGKIPFIDTLSGTRVNLASNMTAEIIQEDKVMSLEEVVSSGRATKSSSGSMVRVGQGEILAIAFTDSPIQIFVRHIPATKAPILAGLDLTAGELTSIAVSLVLVALLALYMSVYANITPEEKVEDQLRFAQFVYTKKPPPPPPPPQPDPPVKPVEIIPEKPKDTKKVEVTEKPVQTKGTKKQQVAIKDTPKKKAAEVKSIPRNVNKPKVFTSTKQGGAVKTAKKEGANAQSQKPKDVKNEGLLSAFGGKGSRSKLDQAYSGTGELLGMAEKATGTSGQSESRPGADVGSRFKDTGAGGKGTATQGISGVGTKGRSSGQSSYGDIGVGGKGTTAIEVGGQGEEFVGTVDKNAVRKVVMSIYNQIKNCYDRQLRVNSNIEGKIIIHWEVVEQGRVRLANVKEASRELRAVGDCVALRIREQRFPEPPQGSHYEVDFPFLMGKQR